VDKGIRVHSLVCNISRVRRTCWNFEMGTRMNSQARIQNEINPTQPREKAISAN